MQQHMDVVRGRLHTQTSGEVRRGGARSRACSFDTGAPIDLRYHQAQGTVYAQRTDSAPEAIFAAEPMAYRVEPFSQSERVQPVAPGEISAPLIKRTPKTTPESPVTTTPTTRRTTTVTDAAPLVQPDVKESVDKFEEDIQALLQESKRRQGNGNTPDTTPASESTDESSAPATEHPHLVFDKMAQNLQYANSFQLAPMALERRFNEFDRELTAADSDRAPATPTFQPVSAQQLRDADIVADLAEIDLARKDAQPPTEPNETSDSPAPAPNVTPPTSPQPAPPPTSPPAVHHKDVPVIQSSDQLTPAQAAGAMIVAWRHDLEPNTQAVVEGTGGWSTYQSALRAQSVTDMLEAFGLTTENIDTFDAALLRHRFLTHGALWLGHTQHQDQARVVTGVDDTHSEVRLRICNPQDSTEEPKTAAELNEMISDSASANGTRLMAYVTEQNS